MSQAIRQLGARAVVRYDQPKWTAYLEGDYASGSSDTTLAGPLTQFHFAEDTNVGLLLFKQVFAYQTAREAAAATSLLNEPQRADRARSSRSPRSGALTDALVLFPQFDVRPVDHVLLRARRDVRVGARGRRSTRSRRRSGASAGTYQNISVNFDGGTPGNYYGTELDGRLQWRYLEHFLFDLEGAVLFPGSALRDEDGHAVEQLPRAGPDDVLLLTAHAPPSSSPSCVLAVGPRRVVPDGTSRRRSPTIDGLDERAPHRPGGAARHRLLEGHRSRDALAEGHPLRSGRGRPARPTRRAIRR